jgi:hypothetical protein
MKSKLANLANLAKGTAEAAKAKALEAASRMPSKCVIADNVESTAGKLAAAIRGKGADANAAVDAKLEVAAGGTRDTESR